MELLGMCVSCDSNCLTLLLECSFLPIKTGEMKHYKSFVLCIFSFFSFLSVEIFDYDSQ
jgi:hypothetical protein